MNEELQKQITENRFIAMMFILVFSVISLYFEYIDQETWKTTVLFAFGIFSGAKIFDDSGWSIEKTKKPSEEPDVQRPAGPIGRGAGSRTP